MKKFLLGLILTLSTLVGFANSLDTIPAQNLGTARKIHANKTGFKAPRFMYVATDTVHSEADNLGMIVFRSADSLLWWANGSYWQCLNPPLHFNEDQFYFTTAEDGFPIVNVFDEDGQVFVTKQILFGGASGGIAQSAALRWEQSTQDLYLGDGTTASTFSGVALNNGRGKISAAIGGLKIDMGAPSDAGGIDDGSKHFYIQNRGNTYVHIWSNVVTPGDPPTYRVAEFLNTDIQIGSGSHETSGALVINSTTKGLVLPRMTKVQRDAIASPIAGMAVYQTDNTPGLRVYNGTNWIKYSESTD